ncbi:hypothetical protein F511_33424 [Dorcoceras hygrometricum]|uniref:Dystroglycan-like n=1 Tax=Dorcoceras hygrometricum TaxID=472368 RepID=A0A2Z7BDT5_9LAMI|nr:hypothetical protein F511_33424 [Dorcoceras hygrometricum]
MSLFDLQDVCIAIGSIATLDLPMVVDLIGIYGLKGPYCTLTTTNWFLQALSVIPRGSWGDVARRSYHDPLGRFNSAAYVNYESSVQEERKDSQLSPALALGEYPSQGNMGSDLLSVTSVEHERSAYQQISPIFCFRHLRTSQSTEMASSFITYALQVNFESVLGISDNEGMLNMFKALESNGVRGFLGCPSVFYEKELEQFFDTALVQDGDITGAVLGKFFNISESWFAEVFKLPTEGLVYLYDVPKDLVYDARSIFSKSGAPISTYGKKRLMKYEFRLLNDILDKSITVKAGSFDAVTNERFLMMTAIHFGIKVNWSKIFFGILKEMVDKTLKKAKGFAAQIYVLLKSDRAITMSEAVPFPSLKILSIKTVNTYVVINENIDARGESDEPDMAKVAVVKRKSQSKKKSKSSIKATGEAPVEVVSEKVVSKKRPTVVSDEAAISKKKRTTKIKASSYKASMDMVFVAQDAVPLQIFKPTPVATDEQPPAPKRKAPKRKLRLTASSDDEFIEKESVVETVVVVQHAPTSADDVDSIIEQVVTETARMDTDEELETAVF